jgi:dissimilatory sulfite reductase flavoprotein subunit
MKNKPVTSNCILERALNWQFPPFSEEQGSNKVVAFGESSHKCPVYVQSRPPCTASCPAGNDIRAWLTTIQLSKLKGRSFEESIELVWHQASQTSPFPAVCGRVCPYPCETSCNRSEKEDGAVNIHAFERWLGDYAIEHGLKHRKLNQEIKTKKVAVIGAGPAGLSCAFQLARHGYPVTVFEAFAEAGGMLRYGIPAYKLPRTILDAEIEAVRELGVEIICNTLIGKDISLDALEDEFDALFIGIGAHGEITLGIEGEDADNVISGVSFLHRIHSGETIQVGSKLVIIGGGDSAISAGRVARRQGAAVTILYRRSRSEMPAIQQEIEAALNEDITIQFLVAPIAIEVRDGSAVSITCQRMELGEPDESGRRRPLPIEGSTFMEPCTTIIPAIGQRPQLRDARRYADESHQLRPDDDLAVDDGVYTGGDILSLRLVTTAIGEGRKAAERMIARMEGEKKVTLEEVPLVGPEKMRLSYYPEKERNRGSSLSKPKSLTGGLDLELKSGMSKEQFLAEAERCMSCGLCFECRECLIFCPQRAIVEYPQNPIGEVMYTNYNKCVGCHLCAQACPCGFIQMGMGDLL